MSGKDKRDFGKIWRKGAGVITHGAKTQKRIALLQKALKKTIDKDKFYRLLAAADLVTNAAMWLVAHQAYVRNVYLDGRELAQDDFKRDPQGHMGGALNMVPAYAGYMLANALTGVTRSWVMEQGHAVSGIDSVNLILGMMSGAHQARYDLSSAGLTRFARDFYSYKLDESGEQDSPLGSHVNPHTSGGFMEGGYLGFASLQYVHMPLRGERLVAFLSDGAFEEQRGADWAARWWRAEDCGLVAPIMIANGRRIDQRSGLTQDGGADWFEEHLKLHRFDPIVFDGRDPAAFAWAVIEMETRLQQYAGELKGLNSYKIKLPYGIAVAPKGAGFYNEGTNYAHNLPLKENPSLDAVAAQRFNNHAKKLYVKLPELQEAAAALRNHRESGRITERDHPLARRDVAVKKIAELKTKDLPEKRSGLGDLPSVSPMDAIDRGFVMMVKANPHLRPRVGNPDEMLSNRMDDTLEELEFRVTKAERGAEESTLGDVITALNEEAVAAAAFGNKGGINIVVTYEAFGAKMYGEARQEVIFAKHQKDLGVAPRWLSVPLVMTSNTWENGKNELSHQDPSFSECMLGEASDVSRVLFPADYNSAAVLIREVYRTHGQVWTVVAAKGKTPVIFTANEAKTMIAEGGVRLPWTEYKPSSAPLALVAIGTYQLIEMLKASARLNDREIPHVVSYIAEPGRFRAPRNRGEKEHLASAKTHALLLPPPVRNVVLATHTRAEPMLGTLLPFLDGRKLRACGFINRGGTLDVAGMLWVNRCSWAHILREAAAVSGIKEDALLSRGEIRALDGKSSPDGVIRPVPES